MKCIADLISVILTVVRSPPILPYTDSTSWKPAYKQLPVGLRRGRALFGDVGDIIFGFGLDDHEEKVEDGCYGCE